MANTGQQNELPDRPFFEKEVRCPICGKVTVHRYLRDYTYVVDRQEEDMFIAKYHWRKKEYEKYNLYFFYLWHCPHCMYTDEKRVFLTPAEKQKFAAFSDVKAKYLEHAPQSGFLHFMQQYTEYPAEDIPSQLNLHFLATYIQLIPEKYSRNPEKIARIYLRISWLYRMANKDETDYNTEQAIKDYFEQHELIQSHVMNTLHNVENMNLWLEEQVKNGKTPAVRNLWQSHWEEFQQIYRTITDHMDPILAAVQHYFTLGKTLQQEYEKLHKNPLNLPYHGFESYHAFLQEARKFWPELPINESEAIQKAVQFYKEVIQYKLYDNQLSKMFNTFKMIIHLNERLENYAESLKYARLLQRHLQVALNNVSRKINSLEGIKDAGPELRKYQHSYNRLNEHLKKANHLEDQVLRKKIEHDEKIARQIFIANRDLAPEKLRDLMEEAGIEETVIEKYINELKSEKKKGIFQLFRF
ncbi:MAG: DUF2225 domain-containing protein [Calditrichaeota bacterium]|nr:DUF2225 domain-containing protein [Calditrichota bacterium]